MYYFRKFNHFILICMALMASSEAHSALITYEFEGTFNVGQSNFLFTSGDTFSGSYTFESTATPGLHPDNSLDTQTVAISNTLPGTAWEVDVFSSVISDFSVSGTNGVIAVGDNTTVFGDRYIATLSSPGATLPGGIGFSFFQIDLQDSIVNGQDLLSDGAFQSLPNLALALPTGLGGRFFVNGDTGGCTQCRFTLTSLTGVSAVPVPAAIWLFSTALIGLVGFGKRRKVA